MDIPPSLSHFLGLGASAAQSTSGTLEVVLGPARAPRPVALAAPLPLAPPRPRPPGFPLEGPVLTFLSFPGLPIVDGVVYGLWNISRDIIIDSGTSNQLTESSRFHRSHIVLYTHYARPTAHSSSSAGVLWAWCLSTLPLIYNPYPLPPSHAALYRSASYSRSPFSTTVGTRMCTLGHSRWTGFALCGGADNQDKSHQADQGVRRGRRQVFRYLCGSVLWGRGSEVRCRRWTRGCR